MLALACFAIAIRMSFADVGTFTLTSINVTGSDVSQSSTITLTYDPPSPVNIFWYRPFKNTYNEDAKRLMKVEKILDEKSQQGSLHLNPLTTQDVYTRWGFGAAVFNNNVLYQHSFLLREVAAYPVIRVAKKPDRRLQVSENGNIRLECAFDVESKPVSTKYRYKYGTEDFIIKWKRLRTNEDGKIVEQVIRENTKEYYNTVDVTPPSNFLVMERTSRLSGDIKRYSSVLAASSATKEDQGLYVCEAWYGRWVWTDRIQARTTVFTGVDVGPIYDDMFQGGVHVTATSPDFGYRAGTRRSIGVPKGDTVAVTCTAYGSNVELRLRHNGEDVDKQILMKEETIFRLDRGSGIAKYFEIEISREADLGEYECYAIAGERAGSDHFMVEPVTLPFLVDVVPRVVERRVMDEFINVTCEISGQPLPSIPREVSFTYRIDDMILGVDGDDVIMDVIIKPNREGWSRQTMILRAAIPAKALSFSGHYVGSGLPWECRVRGKYGSSAKGTFAVMDV